MESEDEKDEKVGSLYYLETYKDIQVYNAFWWCTLKETCIAMKKIP